MTQLNASIVRVCSDYANLMCAARRFSFDGDRSYAMAYFATARSLITLAPREAQGYLASIKSIFEIDTATTDANVILMRASVIGDSNGSLS